MESRRSPSGVGKRATTPARLSPLSAHGALQRSVLKSPSLCTQGNQGSERRSDSPEVLELVHDEPGLYLFIWLSKVLVVARGILVTAGGI